MTAMTWPYRWLALAGFALALVVFGYVQGLQHGADKAQALALSQLKTQEKAMLTRLAENNATAAKQRSDNLQISNKHYEEVTSIRAALDAERAKRMRVPAFCPRLAGPTQAPGTASGNGPDPGERLLPEGVAADIQRLILETELATATGRACQAFLVANGLVP